MLANRELNLGSDHRNVSTLIEFLRSAEYWKTHQRSLKGWESIFDISHEVHLYHSHIQRVIDECPPTSFHEFEKIGLETVSSGGIYFYIMNITI